MHLFLYGDSGVGKSTLIREVLSELNQLPSGFFTRKMPQQGGTFLLNLNPAMGADYSSATCVAEFPIGCAPRAYPDRFNSLGVAALHKITPGSIVLMDELGMLERDAHAFRARVLEVLDFPCRVIGVIKETEDEFLHMVKTHPRVRIMKMTRNNRDEVKRTLMAHLRPIPLAEALGVQPGMTAIVGGGGKTTTMMRLARELSRQHTCIVGTTTHIMPPDCPILLDPSEGELRAALKKMPLLCVGTRAEQGKLGAVPSGLLAKLCEFAEYVILEADGSKGLPLKAPAGHEPVLPENTGLVIALAGMDGAYQPIHTVCHRPKLYAELLGTKEDHIVSPAEIVKVLSHPNGQRKNVTSAFTAVLNKADSPERFRAARGAAAAFPGTAIIAAMQQEPSVFEIWRNGTCIW